MSADTASLLKAATALSGQQSQQERKESLESVLRSRLLQSYASTGELANDLESYSLEELRLETATRALALLTHLQPHLESEAQSADAVPLLGTRDSVVIQTLVSLVFNWGTNALLACLSSKWPDGLPSTSHIVDLTDSALHLQRLLAFAHSVLLLVPLQQPGVTVHYTNITTNIVTKHLPDVIRLGCTLGWAEGIEAETRATIQTKTLQILAVLPPSRTISALGSLLAPPTKQSEAPPIPLHARKVVPGLLSQQLLRPGGVQGLCYALLSNFDDHEDAPYDRLDHIAKVITAVPAGAKVSAYFEQIIPCLFALLTPDDATASSPPSHRRAMAFTLSRLLSHDFRYARITRAIILRTLHLPLLLPLPNPASSPVTALNHIISLVTRMDPAPALILSVLTPIIPALVSLLEHLERTKTTDPELRESVRGLVLAWARVAAHAEAVDRLWAVVQREGGEWEGSHDTLRRVEIREDGLPPLQPSDADNINDDLDLLASNPFMLKPDPAWFVQLLQDMGRNDVAGALFVRVLEAYQETQSSARADESLGAQEADPRAPLLYLQLVVQIQSSMSGALAALAQNPERLLAFIYTTLERHVVELSGIKPNSSSLALKTLRIVNEEEEEEEEEEDSDDENSDSDEGSSEHGSMIVQVALSLLLSLLELHEELLPSDTPSLNALTPLLARLSNNNCNESISRAAREASFVLRARLAAASLSQSSGPKSQAKPPPADDDPQVVYQRALKLIQDPLLPVRASGLALLRSPIILRQSALAPAVLDTFLRTVQDGESFVYLNAVQGLVALALSGGDVTATLVRAYAGGVENAQIDVAELDKRLRVGEALGQVVKHLGEALAVQVNTIVPPLRALLRARDAPAVLRASAVGLLAQCEESADLAIMPYAQDLCGAMLDILQLETEADATEERKSLDDEPTSKHAKHPPLRRAAAHFLAMLLRARLIRTYDSSAIDLDDEWLKRAGVVLHYVGATDKDGIVRAMCREAGDLVSQLFRARMGVE